MFRVEVLKAEVADDALSAARKVRAVDAILRIMIGDLSQMEARRSIWYEGFERKRGRGTNGLFLICRSEEDRSCNK